MDLTILDLLQFELVEVRALGEAQRIEGTTEVLPLLRVRLAIPLGLGESQGEEFHSQDDGEGAPWNGVTEVCGRAFRSGGPFLCLHPVAVA